MRLARREIVRATVARIRRQVICMIFFLKLTFHKQSFLPYKNSCMNFYTFRKERTKEEVQCWQSVFSFFFLFFLLNRFEALAAWRSLSCVTFCSWCHWSQRGAANMDQNNSIPAFQGLASPQVTLLLNIYLKTLLKHIHIYSCHIKSVLVKVLLTKWINKNLGLWGKL